VDTVRTPKLPEESSLLGPSGPVELLRLVFLLHLVDLRLAALPYRLNRRWIFGAGPSGSTPGPRLLARAEALAGQLRRVSRFRLRKGGACLVLSLALRSRLRCLGLAPELVLGVGRPPGAGLALEAHAWLRLGETELDVLGSREAFLPLR
jgi:hypothetical protein